MTKFYMAGTEGTGQYMVVALTNRAKIGYRALGGGVFRVRIEPQNGSSAKTLAADFPAPQWKQVGDGGQERFSTMVFGGEEELQEVVAAAVKAGTRYARRVEVNPDAPEWARGLACDKP